MVVLGPRLTVVDMLRWDTWRCYSGARVMLDLGKNVLLTYLCFFCFFPGEMLITTFLEAIR